MKGFSSEIRRLHSFGFAIHSFPNNRKYPNYRWATKKRAPLEQVLASYRPGMNIGVQLGQASRVLGNYLFAVDIDVKGEHSNFKKEAYAAFEAAFPKMKDAPRVESGRGFGSAHVYGVTKEIISGGIVARSAEFVKVFSPTTKVSKNNTLGLSKEEIAEGYRAKAAWEIQLLADGQQVVLPPSIHPDTKNEYKWVIPFEEAWEIPVIEGDFKLAVNKGMKVTDWDYVENVDLSRLSQDTQNLIRFGFGGAVDRSSVLWGKIVIPMVKAGYDNDEIASVCTNTEYPISECAMDRGGQDLFNAGLWVINCVISKAEKLHSPNPEKNRVFEGVSEDKENPEKPAGWVSSGSGIKYTEYKDIYPETSTSAVVDGLIKHESAAMLFGDTNVGKTFIALHLAGHISAGEEWCGRATEKSPVLYFALEGGTQIQNRVTAFRQENPKLFPEASFTLAQGQINMGLEQGTMSILADIEELEQMRKEKYKVIFIDTLSRAFSGGDENDSKEMGAFVKNVDLIRQRTKATVVLVHHSGKNAERGARGHSLLKGAVDTELEIVEFDKKKHPGVKALFVRKQRDFDYTGAIGFKLREVEVGRDDKDRVIKTCVAEIVNLKVLEVIEEVKEEPEKKLTKEEDLIRKWKEFKTEDENTALERLREYHREVYYSDEKCEAERTSWKRFNHDNIRGLENGCHGD